MEISKRISGKHGAAVLIVSMASLVWILEILRWTEYFGKYSGSYMPNWMPVAWFFCMIVTPILSIILRIIMKFDRGEKVTPWFQAAMYYGCSPALLFGGYLVVTM